MSPRSCLPRCSGIASRPESPNTNRAACATPQAWHEAMDEVIDEQRATLAIPRRLDPAIKEIWISQPRFLQQRPQPGVSDAGHGKSSAPATISTCCAPRRAT